MLGVDVDDVVGENVLGRWYVGLFLVVFYV